MMAHCKTCRHWKAREEENYRLAILTDPYDPDTFEPMAMPFEVRRCTHPKLLFCERPVEDPGFAVADGSTYFAALVTTETFGCVLHEEPET